MNKQMLTFDFRTYCQAGSVLNERIGHVASLGGEGLLTLAFVACGQGRLPEAEPPGLVEAGRLVVSGGAFRLEPKEEAEIAAVVLTGLAPSELADRLSAPMILCPDPAGDIPVLLYRLVEAEPSSMESGLVAYNLLGRLAEARPPAAGRFSALTAAALGEMGRHYAELGGVEDLAGKLGVNKSHLIRVFTADVGRPPGRHLTATRLEAAKRALLRFNHSLETIAGLCGFSNANYLGKVFKKATGLTPAAWRDKIKASVEAPKFAEWGDEIFL